MPKSRTTERGAKDGHGTPPARGSEVREKCDGPLCPSCPRLVTHTLLARHTQKSSEPCPPSLESRAPMFLISSPSQREKKIS